MADLPANRVTSGEFFRPEHDEEPGNQPRSMFWAKVGEVAPEVATSLYDELLPVVLHHHKAALAWDLDYLREWVGYSHRARPAKEWGLADDRDVAGVVEEVIDGVNSLLCLSPDNMDLAARLADANAVLEEWANRFNLVGEAWALRTVWESLRMLAYGPDDEVFQDIRKNRQFVIEAPRRRANPEEIYHSYVFRTLEWRATEEDRASAEARAIVELKDAVHEAFDRMESEAGARLTRAPDAGPRRGKRRDDPWLHIELFVRARVQGWPHETIASRYGIAERTVQKAVKQAASELGATRQGPGRPPASEREPRNRKPWPTLRRGRCPTRRRTGSGTSMKNAANAGGRSRPAIQPSPKHREMQIRT